ncbi:MAG: phosphoenolpyruvate-dependent sugar phosphotransferase system EIIA 2 [Chloroflexi bacterium]|nr:MAG: phosphoenolpyruvate-dependent sugar phosphotransferase system EIIA 2 [Chloroflexota bacterium]
MSIVSKETILINAQVKTKTDAIILAGELLVKAGHVTPDYIDGMLAREETMSTYIGNGVAIPHGQFENKESIRSTGISVVQVRPGIIWDDDEPDERAYLIIGIAATNNEHIGVLSNLAETLEEESAVQELVHTDDPTVIIECLNRPQEEPV